jgi:prolyl 4-hydroxylase
MTNRKKQIIQSFRQYAVEGINRATTIESHKKRYNLKNQDIDWIIAACDFKTAPKDINYLDFYNNQICSIGTPITTSKAQIYCIENFLTPIDCKLLIGVIEQDAVRAKTVSGLSDKRTSSLSSLRYVEHSFYLSIEKKLTSLMGLHPFQSETIQGQKYEIGEFYKPHWDSFSKDIVNYEDFVVWQGQRTWTNMVYLNDVDEGGETNFPDLKIKVKPKKGMLLGWNNLNKDGKRNVLTRHEALPPKSGKKYIITKWWRSFSPL